MFIKKNFIYLFIFFPLLFVANVFAMDVYVSCGDHGVAGSDSYSGLDIDHPKRTIKAGIDALANQGPGNTLYIRGGNYTTIPEWTTGRRGIVFSNLNDATSWDNAYTIRSYPGEWAIIDASQYTTYDRVEIFTGTTVSGGQGFIEFSNMELTGANGLTHTAGILTRGGPFKFRYLYIHDNNCPTSSNNPGGLDLQNGTGETTIEYCHFYRNGCIVDGFDGNGQIVIYSDYIGSWGSQQLYNASGFATARHSNIIRYNLIDGGGVSYTGYYDKSRQYMVSCPDGDCTPVDDNSWSEYNNKIHHNIIKNHREASMEVQSDFVQVYNNIASNESDEGTRGSINMGRSGYEHRGSWRATAYNNTIIGGGRGGLTFNNHSHPPSDEIYGKYYAYNNIIDSPIDGDSNQDLSANKYYGPVTWMDGGADSNLEVQNNLFYNPANADLVKVIVTAYTLTETNAETWASGNYSSSTADLYTDVNYKTDGDFVVGSSTIELGGVGGNHPYLSGVTIPSYVGAVNPNDDAWVDGVLALGSTYMTSASGDPSWIEGSDRPETSPLLKVLEVVPSN